MNATYRIVRVTAGLIGFIAAAGAFAGSPPSGLPVTATVQVTGLSMTLSAADPHGSWMVNASGDGNNLVGAGQFNEYGPAQVFIAPGGYPIHAGTVLDLPGLLPDWAVDTEDGFYGTYRFNRTLFDTNADLGRAPESFMGVTANPVPVGGPGHYTEPFTYSAYFNLCTSEFPEPCNEYVHAIGSGTLDVALIAYPGLPGALEVQSISYSSGRITESVPDPGTLVLFAAGMGGFALSRRSRARKGSEPRTVH